MSEAEVKTIVGRCEEISEKNSRPGENPWVTFNINAGSQYPVKLSTKLPNLIEQARAVGGEQATWTFKESEGKENPNRPGTNFVNRYLEGVEVGGEAAPAGSSSAPAPQQRPTEGAHGPVAIGDKDRIISRLACLKAACELYSGSPITQADEEYVGAFSAVPPGAVIEAAARFEVWIYRDLDATPF